MQYTCTMAADAGTAHGHALIVGATGISGGNVASRLLDDGWRVSGLSRRADGLDPRATHLPADLLDADATAAAVRGTAPTHVFFTTWSRRATEAENIAVNGAMLQHLLDAVAAEGTVRHVALVTGLKHYLGPFEAYAKAQPDTPFSEEQPRLPYENFYYVQEDILWAAAERDGFTWSVHRPHTMIGWALGNAMNMGVTLAVYAAICRETGRRFRFPGSEQQWEAVTDVTDARLLADHLVWAATTPAAANEALNIVNGDVFRWRRLWPRLAAALGVEPEGFDGAPQPLEQQMADAGEVWPDASCGATACATSRSTRSRRGGTRTPTSDARSRRSRTWAAAGASGSRGVQRHGVLVHRSLRPPARRAHRAVSTAPAAPPGEVARCARSASTPSATCASRTWPSRPSPGPGQLTVQRRHVRHLRHRPARVHRRAPSSRPAEPHPLTGAQNPQILGPRVRRRGRRGRRGRHARRASATAWPSCRSSSAAAATTACAGCRTSATAWAASGSRTAGAGCRRWRPSTSSRSCRCPRA